MELAYNYNSKPVWAQWRHAIVVGGVRHMKEVNVHRARLVLGWVTVFGWVYHLGL